MHQTAYDDDVADAVIIDLLSLRKTLVIVGLSADPAKPSYHVAEVMQRDFGCRIVPVRPGGGTILGEAVCENLAAAEAKGVRVADSIVVVFRNSAEVPAVVEAAITAGVTALWLQLGVAHQAAIETARASGMLVVADRCIKLEAQRLLQPVAAPNANKL